MSYRVELHPAALKELKEAYWWYEERSEGLGNRFVAAVDKRLEQIIQDPERYAKKKGNYREVAVAIFPYLIIYEVFKKEKLVFVSSVLHTRRNPKFKYRR